MFLHEWGTLQGYVGADCSRFSAVRKSLEKSTENRLQISESLQIGA